jgi:hypothetical protein
MGSFKLSYVKDRDGESCLDERWYNRAIKRHQSVDRTEIVIP